MRTQYAHIIDMVPTVLDALSLEPPATIRGVTQSPIHGVSFAHTSDERMPPPGTAPSTSRCSRIAPSTMTGWRAVCPWPGPSFAEAGKPFGAVVTAETLTGLYARDGELYHVAEDPAENHDLAEQHRGKLIELIATWYAEAGKYDVFPIDGSAVERMMTERPQIAEPRAQYIFRPHTQTLPFWVGPRVLNRPHSITADAEIPDGGAEGALICQGSNGGGWTFYVQDGRLHYAHNYVGRAIYRVSAPTGSPPACISRASSSSPPGNPTSRRARALRAWPSCTSTASHRQHRVPGHHADRLQPRRAYLRRQSRLRDRRGLSGAIPLY